MVGQPYSGKLNVRLDERREDTGNRRLPPTLHCNVFVKSRAAGKRVMASLEAFLCKRLRLKVNREKSAVARPWARKFLGYSFTSNLKPKLKVSPQSVKRLKAKLRPVWKQGRGGSIASTVARLNPIIRGWVAYFRMVEVKAKFEELDSWTRRKLRGLIWRQWKTPRTRLRRLLKLGVDAPRARAGAMNNRGPWWNAGASHMNQAISNNTLRGLGLVSFLDEHRRLECFP